MELLFLHFHHVCLFQPQGTVVIAIVNSKTSGGLQQSLSLYEPDLVSVLCFLWTKVRSEGKMFTDTAASFRSAFAALVSINWLVAS